MKRAALPGIARAWLCACQSGGTAPTRPVVAVSVPPQAFFVERLAGDSVEVVVMLPPGANAHAYEPTLREMRAVSEAALYVKVGHPKFTFEQSWLDALVRDRPDLTVIDSSSGIDLDPDDPHTWLTPANGGKMAHNIAAALGRLPGARSEEIDRNLAALIAETGELDDSIRRRLAGHRGERFFVFHPAWGYFAREYGLRQVAIERDGREPDPKTLATTIDDARTANVQMIFVQPRHSGASAQLVADEVGARLVVVDPLASDWLAGMRHASEAIVEGLVP